MNLMMGLSPNVLHTSSADDQNMAINQSILFLIWPKQQTAEDHIVHYIFRRQCYSLKRVTFKTYDAKMSA